jgi:DNA polymerase-3 subunit epsilon/ATP-dependent DNA helicase DinG
MFYWVNNLPDPDNQAKYRTLLEYAITTICEYIKGNILFIFNSHGFMESVIKKVNGALTKLGTEIIELERENERIDLFDNISNSQKKVVFCTYAQLEKSFLPTNSFPIVVFTRLPIQDLSDPVLMSQLEYFDDPFNDFTLPEAVRSFKYALQFVDHREHKKSSALIMDSRILSKEYGKLFLRDVPVCSVSSGNLLHFIKSASDWMS